MATDLFSTRHSVHAVWYIKFLLLQLVGLEALAQAPHFSLPHFSPENKFVLVTKSFSILPLRSTTLYFQPTILLSMSTSSLHNLTKSLFLVECRKSGAAILTSSGFLVMMDLYYF